VTSDQAGFSDTDLVWNRAALEAGGPSPGPGDVALASLLSLHSVAMNGGVLHSVEHHSAEELTAGVAGYRYFGLPQAGEVFEWVADCLRNLESAPHEADDLEIEADNRYAAAVPDDSTLAERFEQAFRDHPDAFAPVQN